MIEIEKKFQPTLSQQESLLEDSVFVGMKSIHDIYYDYQDFRFLKNGVKLRKRNDNFELKIKTETSSNLEIENIKEIEEYLGIDNLEKFIKEEGLIPVADYETERQEYTKEQFTIHRDKTNFGYEVCEIELIVENEEKAKKAREKVIRFAESYGLEMKKLLPKSAEYFKVLFPEIYNELYGNKNNEVKMK